MVDLGKKGESNFTFFIRIKSRNLTQDSITTNFSISILYQTDF
jgi:hypothetical protein